MIERYVQNTKHLTLAEKKEEFRLFSFVFRLF